MKPFNFVQSFTLEPKYGVRLWDTSAVHPLSSSIDYFDYLLDG